jgi:hypothetical protein
MTSFLGSLFGLLVRSLSSPPPPAAPGGSCTGTVSAVRRLRGRSQQERSRRHDMRCPRFTLSASSLRQILEWTYRQENCPSLPNISIPWHYLNMDIGCTISAVTCLRSPTAQLRDNRSASSLRGRRCLRALNPHHLMTRRTDVLRPHEYRCNPRK